MQSSTEADTAALYNLSIDEIVQRIKAMQRQEKSSSSLYNKDYLSVVLQQQHQQHRNGLPPLLQLSPNTTIEQIMKQHIESRTKMAQWCYQLTDICNLSRHAVTRAMAFLDRYLATIVSNNNSNNGSSNERALLQSALTDQRHYQLLSMTSLYIIIKIHEPLAMDASLLSEISAGCYTTHEILDMERHMLSVTRWCGLHDCTHQEYITLLLGLCNPKWYRYNITVLGCVLDVALYHVELATCDYYLMNSKNKKSEVALASILNALESVNDEEWSSHNVKYEFVMRLVEVLSLDDENDNDSDDVDMMMTRVADIQDRLRKLFCCQNSSDSNSNDSSGNNAMAVDDDDDQQEEIIPQEDEEEDYRCSRSHYSKKNSSSSSMRCATNTNTNTSTSNHGTSSRRSRRTTSSSSSTHSSRRRGSSSHHRPQEVIVVNKKCTDRKSVV